MDSMKKRRLKMLFKKNYLFFILLFPGLLISFEYPLYETVSYNVPVNNVQEEVYLGDRMLEQQRGQFRECIIPKTSLEKKYFYTNFVVQPNKALCKNEPDSKLYSSRYTFYENRPTANFTNFYQDFSDVRVRLDGKSGKYNLRFCHKALLSQRFDCPLGLKVRGNLDDNLIKIDKKYFLYELDSSQQAIEYAGREGNILKFTYSEFVDGFRREVFNREFRLELDKGDIAAFKGAIIKVHEADNIRIVYSVIRGFK